MTFLTKLEISKFSSVGGDLSVIDGCNLPFQMKRLYWISNTPEGVIRGLHAHKKLFQFFTVIRGQVEIEISDGKTSEIFILQNDNTISILEPGFWRELRNFSFDCILLVGASEDYSEEDYIRNWDEFLIYRKLKLT